MPMCVKQIACFSKSNKIHNLVPKILEIHDSVEFKQGNEKGNLGKVIDSLIESGLRKEGESYKVILLSAPDDPQTKQLEASIENDLTSENGRRTAFTQNQRYVSLELLKKAKKASELIMKN